MKGTRMLHGTSGRQSHYLLENSGSTFRVGMHHVVHIYRGEALIGNCTYISTFRELLHCTASHTVQQGLSQLEPLSLVCWFWSAVRLVFSRSRSAHTRRQHAVLAYIGIAFCCR